MQRLHGLKAINFIYGANGSGKTTISRVIAEREAYPNCSLTWSDGRPLERVIYNRDFVHANYRSRMPGIFTLGDQNRDALDRIDELRVQISRLEDDISSRQANLGGPDGTGGKLGELQTLRSALDEACWIIKNQHDAAFQDAFTGYRGAKADFCTKLLQEADSNQSNLCDVEALKKRATTVFAKDLQPARLIATVPRERLVAGESAAILAKKVVGKEDVEVAKLIRKLGNSDWVKKGLTYLPHSEDECPFCQQRLPPGLEAALGEYFDETYAIDINAIASAKSNYDEAAASVIAAVETLIASAHPYIDDADLRGQLERLIERIDANKRRFEDKEKEPSLVVSLEPTAPIMDEIGALIARANREAEAQNQLLANLNAEQATLAGEIWRFVVEEAKDAVAHFNAERRDVDAAIAGLKSGIAQKQAELAAATAELHQLERSITSVEPTVTEINKLLASFGFRGFRLATAGEGGSQYEVVRPNGADATETLSEGERTFVTFLYFYHLLRGSASQTGVVRERVVVIDDPVSSLDSDILFIVSSLIKKVLNEACEGTGLIKQVFVMTHNIYFHKEVSFDPKRKDVCRHHETFWIVRKREDVSIVDGHDRNPIRTSYELLWAEVKNPQRSNLTVQNTLRRILENYFTVLGNIDKDTIIDLFDGQDRLICGALFSWVNDGSHSAHDDLYLACDEETVGKFLRVFKEIFVKAGHEKHYEMMIGEEIIDEQPQAADNAVLVAVATNGP